MTETVQEQMEKPLPEQRIDSKIVQYAVEFGLVKLGWVLKDYIIEAVKTMGYETVLCWAMQGAGKSNLTLQEGYWILGDWDKVLKALVFKPQEFVKRLKEIPKYKRVPWVGWDDIGVHYASSSWRTNIQQYEAIDETWAAIRTKCSVVSLNIPLINRLARNLKDNISFEIFSGKNQNIEIFRYVRLPSFERPEANFFKVLIEPIHKFDIYNVPTDVFKQYWDMRLELTEEALSRLGRVVTKTEAEEDLINIHEAIAESQLSAKYIIDVSSRGLLRKEKIEGLLYFNRNDWKKFMMYREKRID